MSTVTRPNPGNPPVKTPRTLGDGGHSAGSGGTNRMESRENFKGQPGMFKPPSGDGRSAGMDGVIEGKVNVPRTRIMGKHDTRGAKK
jgi:hypothetical protein